MKNIYLIPVLVFFFISCQSPHAQRVIQQNIPKTGQIQLGEDISIPMEDAGYTLILPEEDIQTQGLVVFFNSDRDTTNKLFHYAGENGLAVLFVSTGNRLEFLFETDKKLELEQYIQEVITHHKIPKSHLLFLGMSLAGTRAIKMAQFAKSPESKNQLWPRAVAICDAPLDFVRFWESAELAENLGFHLAAANEGKWVSAVLEKNLGGTPDEKMDNYLNYSPYSKSDRQYRNVSLLKENIAIRAYTEPDVNWWIETRRKDLYDMNTIDAAALINMLRRYGNQEAELILTQDKGYLPDGQRHPHSWSIVDEKELIDWFLSKIK